VKRIHLHVGLHKTGTSYIQSLCAANKNYLERNSYSYVDILYNDYSKNHYFFADAIGKTDYDLKSLNNRLKAVEFDNLIISAENFSEPNNLLGLVDCFEGFDVHPIIYLRRNDLINESAYCELVRNHGLSEHIFSYRYAAISFLDQIYKWGGIFGFDSLRVRSYHSASDDIGYDFFETIGINNPVGYHQIPRVNITAGKVDVYVRYFVNRHLSHFSPCEKNLIHQDLISKIPSGLFYGKYFMSPHSRKFLYDAQYIREHEILSKLFFCNKPLWDDDFSDEWADIYSCAVLNEFLCDALRVVHTHKF